MRLYYYSSFIKEAINIGDIRDICSKYRIRNYTINDDGSVDIDGDVDLYSHKLTKLPLQPN